MVAADSTTDVPAGQPKQDSDDAISRQQQQPQEQQLHTDAPEQLTEQELDAMIAEALDCPCVKDLRESACGTAFQLAFTCYHKSMAVPKGYDCVEANLSFAECLRQHPDALATLQAAGDEAFSMPAPPPPTATSHASAYQ